MLVRGSIPPLRQVTVLAHANNYPEPVNVDAVAGLMTPGLDVPDVAEVLGRSAREPKAACRGEDSLIVAIGLSREYADSLAERLSYLIA